MKEKVLEPKIKSMLINHLISKGLFDNNDLIINEFLVGDYSRRVDLALIRRGQLFAFEIKSEADTLYRLNGQVEKYLEYFDKVVVVTTKRHSDNAVEMTPNNVAIWEVGDDFIKVKRRGRKEKTKERSKLIELMTTKDLLKFLREQNVTVESTRRSQLVSISMNVPLYKIREGAIRSIQDRYKSTNIAFWEKIYDRSSTPEDLLALRVNPIHKKMVNYSNIDNFIEAIECIDENEIVDGIQVAAST